MPNRTWIFDIDGKPHEVLLKFGLIAGRQIWLDGSLINKGRNLFEMGSEYHFVVDRRPAELGIVSTPAGYEYYLRVDNNFVFSKNNKKQKIGKYTSRKFAQRQVWLDIGSKYGLEYQPFSIKPFVYQHRLIGFLENFLVVIAPGFSGVGDSSVPGCYLVIRHSILDADKIKELKNSEDVKKVLKDTKTRPDWFEIQPGVTNIFAAGLLKKFSEIELAERLVSVFHVLSKGIRPTVVDKCEGVECKTPYFTDLQLTLVNGIPQVMCQECIDGINDIGKKVEEEYKKQPNNLMKGVLYGLAAAFLGAIGWALVMVFLDTIGAAFALLIFFLVIKAMDYAKTKRTFISLFTAGLLSLAGSIAGSYLGLVGYLIKEGNFAPTFSEFIRLAKAMLEKPKLLNETILFSLIGLVPYLFITWSANRKHLKQFFKPKIEVIPTFPLKR
ncbi:MAG: hypothetical protein ACOYZ6_08600 [Chloroflexota bacterium]